MEYDDDKERLIRLSSGDHEAFRILFTRYQPGLKKYIAFHYCPVKAGKSVFEIVET